MNLEIITLILMLIILLLGLILAIIHLFSSKNLEIIALILMLIALLLELILVTIDSWKVDADPLNFFTIVLILGVYGTVRRLIDKIKETKNK